MKAWVPTAVGLAGVAGMWLVLFGPHSIDHVRALGAFAWAGALFYLQRKKK